MATLLRRAPSTISREIHRNGGQFDYRANHAEQAVWQAVCDRAKRPKTCKLAKHPDLAHLVAGKLKLQWSPEQIATLVERQTRYLMLVKIPAKDTETVVAP